MGGTDGSGGSGDQADGQLKQGGQDGWGALTAVVAAGMDQADGQLNNKLTQGGRVGGTDGGEGCYHGSRVILTVADAPDPFLPSTSLG